MNFSVITAFSLTHELAKYLEVYDDLPAAGWNQGRQGNGYEKYLLGSSDDDLEIMNYPFLDDMLDKSLRAMGADKKPEFWDCYFVLMKDGSYITPHTDPTTKGPHHRINTLVMSSICGGIFTLEGTPAELYMGDALKFRPDLDRHEVTMVAGDCKRLMFSVGCILPVE
jgi:hypothetical protein